MAASTPEMDFLSATIAHAIGVFPESIKSNLLEVVNFRMSLVSESDRASALMAAAFLENYLVKLMQAFMVQDSKVQRDVFSHNGAFGTFSSKIDSAYLLGLISKKTHDNLHLLRKIRNEFAHVAEPLSFSTHKIKSRCQAFHDVGLVPKGGNIRTKFNRIMMIAAQEMIFKLISITAIEQMVFNDSSESTRKSIANLAELMRAQGLDSSLFDTRVDLTQR